jgi:hypothetical protein
MGQVLHGSARAYCGLQPASEREAEDGQAAAGEAPAKTGRALFSAHSLQKSPAKRIYFCVVP